MADDDKKNSDDDLLAEVRKRLQICISAESDNRSAALDDLEFVAGDHWPDTVKRQRTIDQRPCLTINKLPTFLHQVTNDQRQNRPSIKVHPVDSGADVETAEVIQGLIRHIEYSSNADVAYDTAVNSAAAIGFGYFRLVTDYESDDSFDQEIRFKRIRNSFTVYGDPAAQEPDGSDSQFWIISTEMPKEEFSREYPNAGASSWLQTGVGDIRQHWISDDMVRVAEYYCYKNTKATLIKLSNGETGWKDDLLELPEGVTIVQERESARKKVCWYKVTAVDVLEEAEIPCDWIPVFPVYGDELDIEGKVIRSGLVRHAKDPSQMYDFWMTSATEEIALRPKTPYIMAEGQEEGHEAEWAQANNRSFPYLTYKPTTVAGQLAPPPQRQPMADVPAGMLQMAMHASDNIKATTGIFDASLGAKGNETSGRAIVARQREGDVANFHFTDNLTRTIRHVGRCIISMIPRIYDAERVVRILGDDETVSSAVVNQPLPQPKQDPKTGAIKTVLNDLTVGKYDVTVTAGPSYSTLRQEAADAMIQFGQSWPKLMDIAGDKVVKAMDWPGAEEIAERIERTIPPEIRQSEEDQQGQPLQLPPEVQQQMQQADQHIQQLTQALQEAQSGIDKEKIKAQSAENVARINAESKQDVEELKGMIQMLLAKMQPPPILAADVAQDMRGDDPPNQNENLPPSGGFFSPENSAPMQGPASGSAPMGQPQDVTGDQYTGL